MAKDNHTPDQDEQQLDELVTWVYFHGLGRYCLWVAVAAFIMWLLIDALNT